MAVQGVSPKRRESKLKFRGAPSEWHHLSETPITSHSEPACALARNDTVSGVPYTINSNLQKQTINSEKTQRLPKKRKTRTLPKTENVGQKPRDTHGQPESVSHESCRNAVSQIRKDRGC